MKFDNQAFESKVAATIQSLDSLKKSLDFSNTSKGFSDLEKSAANFTLQGISSAIENINQKFSAMGAVGFSVINNLTSMALSAGEKLAKSLSLDQTISGFQEYNTNINSVQTILANTNSKGTTLDQVNKALDELNTYSDKTIYNFSEMTKNVGTFTAAGVDLETAVSAIKGIANIAALSGSSAEQAATGMYQLSQAIATGTVRLIDWNSVQNAGFGGEIFQKSLFETGKALKTINDTPLDTTFEAWKKVNGSFRDSLSGTTKGVNAAADEMAKATQEATKMVATAEKDLADTTETQNQRVIDAKKRVADETKNGAEAIQNASQRQQQTIKDDAKAIESAWQSVIDARKRLENALKPASEDALAAAQDRLTASQLDQADLSDAIARADLASSKALDRLTKAQKKYKDAQASGNLDAQNTAFFDLQDAQNAVADAADGVARAQLRQNAAARDVTKAQEDLQAVQQKGSATDQNVLSAQDALQNAQDRYAQTLTDSAQREKDAADSVAKAQEDSVRRQTDAASNLVKAEEDRTSQIERVQDRLAKAHEDAAARIAKASDSVQFGWLTSDVLTTTLKVLTGDLSDAQVKELGFSDAQVAYLQNNARLASNAAKDVKTLPQLLNTVRESVGSGWALTFRTIFGTFTEAKATFTEFNEKIGAVAQASAAARNKMLDDWKTMGGRTLLIKGITDSFRALASFIRPLREAFRDIFPRKTGAELFELTKRFVLFAERMRLSGDTAEKLRRVFRGIFAAFDIVRTVVKDVAQFFGRLIKVFFGIAGSPILDTLGGLADILINIDKKLKNGKGLEGFFNILLGGAKKIATVFKFLLDVVVAAFKGIGSGALTIGQAITAVGAKMGAFLKNLGGPVWDKIAGFFNKAADGAKSLEKSTAGSALSSGLKYLGKAGERLASIFHGVWTGITTLASGLIELGKLVGRALGAIWGAIKKNFGNASFSGILDALNVGLLGGIALILTKFLNQGVVGLLGGGGILKSIKGVFNGITDTLGALQAQLKAGALTKIAIAIALLAGSLLLLSLIDSGSLTKGLVALSVLSVILSTMINQLGDLANSLGGTKDLAVIVGSLVVLSVALLILTSAVKKLSKLDPAGTAIGVTAILVMLEGITKAVKEFSSVNNKDSDLIKAALGIFAIASAIKKLGKVVVFLGSIDPKELAQGLVAVGLLLTGLTIAIDNLPKKDEGKVGSLVGFAFAIYILGFAVKSLGGADYDVILKGLGAVGVILAGLVVFFQQLDKINAESISVGLVGFAAGLVVLSVALRIIGSMDMEALAKGIITIGIVLGGLVLFLKGLASVNATELSVGFLGLAVGILAIGTALRMIGSMSVAELAKGLIALGLAIPILAIGLFLMEEAGPGAIVLPVAAAGLLVLAAALKAIGSLSIGTIVKGLVGVVAFIAVLAGASILLSAAIGPMILMGAALLVIGAGFALFGLGAKLFAEAIDLLAKSGDKGIAVFKALLGAVLDVVGEFLSGFIGGFGSGLLQLVGSIVKIAPQLAKAFGPVIIEFLKSFGEAIPHLAKTVGVFIGHLIKLIVDKAPDLIAAGFRILMDFLGGILDNIGEITVAVAKIIVTFLEGLASKAADLVGAGLDLLVRFLEGVASGITGIAGAVADIIVAFVKAIADGAVEFAKAGVEVFTSFLNGIANGVTDIAAAGTNIVISFLEAIASYITQVTQAGVDILVAILDGIASAISQVSDAATNVILAFIDSTVGNADKVVRAGVNMMVSFLEGLAKGIIDITAAAGDVIIAFIQGIGNSAGRVSQAASDTVVAFLDRLDDNLIAMVNAGFEFVISFINGLADAIDKHAGELQDAGKHLAWSILDGVTFGLAGKAKGVFGSIIDIGGGLLDSFGGFLGINSPSKEFIKMAGYIGDGIKVGLDRDKSAVRGVKSLGGRVITSFQSILEDVSNAFEGFADINPTITPVLDLTGIQRDAKTLSTLINANPIDASLSFGQASALSFATTQAQQAAAQTTTVPTGPSEIKFEQHIIATNPLSVGEVYRQTKNMINMAKEELSLT
jgi:tape measure domain-containing protein